MVYHITYDEGRHKIACPVKNREELMALRNSKDNLRHLAAYRKGKQGEKEHLLQLAYNAWPVDGVLAGCQHISSSFFHDIDCYDKEQSEAMKLMILSKKDEIGLLMLEKSPSGGWHLVCRRERGKTILENQVRVACILHIEMDTNVKDLQRVVFSTSGSEEDLPFLDDAIFEEPMTMEESAAEYQLLKERERKNLEEVPAGAKKARKHYKPWEEWGEIQSEEGKGIGEEGKVKNESDCQLSPVNSWQAKRAKDTMSQLPPVTCQLSPPTDRTLYIFDACMREAGLQENDLIEEGGRHNALKSILSVGATQLLTQEELNGVLQVRMAANWQDANIQTLVNDFYQKYTDSSQKMTQFQRKVFAKSRKLNGNLNLDESSPNGLPITGEMSEGQRGSSPSMPKKLPKLVELLTSKTPMEYKEAVAHAVFPALGTHLCNVRFEYTDYVEHEATLMNCLMAGTGSGKGCIDKPIEHIMADIKKRDKENEDREKEWKKDCQKKGANKDKMVRPEGLVIQMIDPDMTKPALVTRLDESEGHFVYVKLNELDLFNQLKGQTGNQHFQLMCLAFDPDSEYGQTRIGTQSVTARPQCRFNWNACSTILKGRRFFRNVLTDGPISRINFCTIPEQEIGADQPIYGKYDAAFDEALKPYIDNLVAARGLINCPQAWRLAKKLQAECAEFARLSQNDVYWNLSHRACVIAWLKACVLYVANGQKWEKAIEDFIRWSLNYDLWCKMEFFGEDIAKANKSDERVGKRGPRNLLELLPEVFTLEDAKRVRRQEGLDTENTIKMVRNWKSRNYVTQISDISFQKSKKSEK